MELDLSPTPRQDCATEDEPLSRSHYLDAYFSFFFLGLFLFEGREEGREREREKGSSPILGNFADIFRRFVDFSIELLIEAFNRKTGLKFPGLTRFKLHL